MAEEFDVDNASPPISPASAVHSAASAKSAEKQTESKRSHFLVRTYYDIKPLLPHSLQLLMRRWRAHHQRVLFRDLWPIDPCSATPPPGWTGWPEKKRFALVLTHDVEWHKGQMKCLQLAQMEQERGFRSAFYFVPRRYSDDPSLRAQLTAMNFEVGVHGLYHDGKLYRSREIFSERAEAINQYIRDWDVSGFRSPSMHHNLEWLHDLNVLYDASTFDTDPFEPQPDGMGTIFPFVVQSATRDHSYIELPYTLPQDYTTFILLREKGPELWRHKLDWLARNGGMALVITHPDYMMLNRSEKGRDLYPARYYLDFLDYVRSHYDGQYWQALPQEVAHFIKDKNEAIIPEAAEQSELTRGLGS